MNSQIEVEIPNQFAELVLKQAAEREIPVEELFEQIIKKYMERRDHNAE